MRRFESCWGRTVTTSENSALTSYGADYATSPIGATVLRGATRSVGFHSLSAPARERMKLVLMTTLEHWREVP